jgi:hypothetical protein
MIKFLWKELKMKEMKPIEEPMVEFKELSQQTLVERLRIRASIRRNNTERKSVQEGKPDRISDLLEESADEIERLYLIVEDLKDEIYEIYQGMDR